MGEDCIIIIPFPFDSATVRNHAAGNPDTYLKFIKYATSKGCNTVVLGQNETDEEAGIEGLQHRPVTESDTGWLVYALRLWLTALFSSYPDNTVVINSHPLYLLPCKVLTDHSVIFERIYEEGEAVESVNPGLVTTILTKVYA